MAIPKALFPYPDALTSFARAVKNDLFAQSNIMHFTIALADAVPDIEEKNKHILDRISNKSGVYAIWVITPEQAAIKYIGHTDGKTSRPRIRNHFITKHEKTGAQLENVKDAIQAGNRVGLTFVEIEPAELRLYVEVMLIKEILSPDCWNIKSRQKQL
jgi:hypothetical protein